MKKKHFFNALLAVVLLLPLSARADQLTVADGTTTTGYAPIYGWYSDYGYRVETFYPADMLSEMLGGAVNSMTFYSSTSSITYTGATTNVYIEEVASATANTSAWHYSTNATLVWTGVVTIQNGMWSIEFDTPFQYSGGDLLVYTATTGDGPGTQCYFYGISRTAAADYYYGSTGPSASAPTGVINVLPKCTFDYTMGGGPICRKPNNLVVSNITTDGATLSWNTRNGESSWKVYADGQLVTTVYDSSYTFVNLSASSQHTLGVSAVCGDESESGIALTTFRTACDIVTLPWSEGFEGYATGNGNRPDCWATLQSYTTSYYSYPYVSSSYSHEGTKSYYMYYSNMVATPMFNTPANQLHVSFWARLSGSSSTLEAGIMTDTADMTTFVPLLTLDYNNSTWTEYEFYTDTVQITDNACVAFRRNDASGYACYIDELQVSVASDCRRPINPVISGVTYEGANIGWTDDGAGADAYVVRVSKTNNVNATAVTDFDATTTSVTIYGLDGNTTYYAWVASVCNGDTTQWRACGSFTTQLDCYSIENLAVADMNMSSALLTWTYQDGRGRNVDGVSIRLIDQSATPADTTTIMATGTTAFLTGLQSGHTYRVEVSTMCDTYSASSVYTTFSLPTCGKVTGSTTVTYAPFHANWKYGYSQTIYPASVAAGINQISGIMYRQSSTPSSAYTRTIDVYIGNTSLSLLDTNNYIDTASMTKVASDFVLNVQNTGWKTITFDQPFANDGTSNIVVAVLNKTGAYSSFSWGGHSVTEGNSVYWYSDDIVIGAANPNAGGPSRGKTTTVPDITFVGDCETSACAAPLAAASECTENSVTLVWMAGASETAWTVEYRVATDTAWQVAETSTSSTSTIVSGLESSTLYAFRVGSLCDGNTIYGPVFTYRTACGTITLPFTEGFEGWTGNYPFPACWTKMQGSGNYPYIYNGTSYRHNGTASMYGSTSNTLMYASPLVPADADNIKVTFWAYNWTANGSGTQAGVVTDVNDPTSFIPCTVVATGLTENSMREYEFYTDNVTAAGQVYVAFRTQTSSSVYVDDVNIKEAGFCRKPNTPSVDNVGYYTATLHWNDVNHGTATYEVCYNTENDLAGATLYEYTSFEDSIQLENLQNNQLYYAWVRPTCSTSNDDWLAMPAFTTEVSCYPVQNISLVGATLTTAAINWDYNMTQGLAPQGAVLNLMDGVDSAMVVSNLETDGTSHIFTNLEGGHPYVLYISTVCDPDMSAAVQYRFSTYTPSCGSYTGSGDSTYYFPMNGYYNYSVSQTIYPAISIDTVVGISYRVRNNSQTRTIDVYMANTAQNSFTSSSSPVPGSSLTLVASNHSFNGAPGWVNIPFDTPFVNNGGNIVVVVCDHTGTYASSSTYALRFARHSTSGYSTLYSYNDNSTYNPSSMTSYSSSVMYAADIEFMGNCDLDNPCVAPVLVVDSLTTTAANLSWMSDDATALYTIEYRAADDTAWTEDASGIGVTDWQIAGLNPSTAYQFRVGYECGGSMVYSAAVTAYTECDAMAVPQTFTFATELSPCWTLTNSAVSRSSSSNALYFTYNSNGQIGAVVLPEFVGDITTLKVTIDARYSSYSESLMVGVCDNNGGNVTWVETVPLTSSYSRYTVYLDTYTGTENRIVVSKGSAMSYMYIDTIWVDVIESCRPVQGVSATAAGSTSATVGWSHTSASNFEVQYRPATDNTWQSLMVTGTSTTLTGLTASTAYNVRVRTICSESDVSEWSNVVNFTTACGAVDLPFSEVFDSWTSFAECWERLSGEYSATPATSTASSGWNLQTSYGSYIDIDGKALCMNLWSTYNYWFVTPGLNILSDAELTFDIAVSGYSNANNDFDDDDYLVVAATADGVNYTQLYKLGADTACDGTLTSLGNVFTTVTVPVNGFAGQTIRIAICGGSLASGGDNRVVIDNISIVATGAPLPCDAPVIGNVSATTSTVTIQFSSAAQSNEVAIVQGAWVAPASGTVVSGNSYVFGQLQPSTQYTVGVRAVCSGGRYSEWATRPIVTLANSQGIDDVWADAVNIYPNPASSIVTVDGIEGRATVIVVDQSGRTVYSAVADGKLSIDVSHMAKGAYFVRIVADRATAVRKLIVK